MSIGRAPKDSTKKPVVSSVWLTREKNLRALGLGSDIKGVWTDSKKQKIQRLYKQWGAIANEPKAFQKVSVKNLGPAALADIKESGYKLKGTTAYIPLSGYDKAKIQTEYRKRKDGTFERIVAIKRTVTGTDPTDKTKVTKESTTYLGSGLRQMDHLARLEAEYKQGQFKDDEIIGLQNYDNSPMARSHRLDIGSLLKYFSNIQWKNANSEAVREKLKANTHVVKFRSSVPNWAAFEKSTNKKISASRKRSRKAAKAQFKGRGPK